MLCPTSNFKTLVNNPTFGFHQSRTSNPWFGMPFRHSEYYQKFDDVRYEIDASNIKKLLLN